MRANTMRSRDGALESLTSLTRASHKMRARGRSDGIGVEALEENLFSSIRDGVSFADERQRYRKNDENTITIKFNGPTTSSLQMPGTLAGDECLLQIYLLLSGTLDRAEYISWCYN